MNPSASDWGSHTGATTWYILVRSKDTCELDEFDYTISPSIDTTYRDTDEDGFVDDNDDQDRFADWKRLWHNGDFLFGTTRFGTGGLPDPQVFPGYDENADFISDFNQNANTCLLYTSDAADE